MVYLCVCFGSMFTVLVQRYSKLHSAEALIVVNWPMGVADQIQWSQDKVYCQTSICIKTYYCPD